ncbi:MAG: peptide-methionine (S)-S-oxide reductase MsrA [Myxococcota bacterium]
MEKATFAAGCFWGVESTFRKVPGVVSAQVGYTGGGFENPTYEIVCSGRTGHAEAVELEFDPSQISYEELLEVFWSCHDPTTWNRQGPDTGTQYRSVVFFHTPEQEAAVDESRAKLADSGRYRDPIVTEIIAAATFYPAEEYHQRYLEKRGLL